jgi:hypothetical protein
LEDEMEDQFESGPFEPWVILPTQLEGSQQPGERSGSLALMLAVLEDAIRCIERGRGSRRFRARSLAAEAQTWVRSDSREWPFAFASICDVLGLEVDAVRSRLLPEREDAGAVNHRRTPVRRITGAGRTSIGLLRSARRAA